MSLINENLDTPNQAHFHSLIHILLAEDIPTNQKVAVGILRKLGFDHVTICNDGAEALDLMQHQRFDLVLMDLQMPEVDGIQAARVIRDPMSSILQHDIPIIALSANVLQSDKARCVQAGMNGHIDKPIQPQVLAETLSKWLPNTQAQIPPPITPNTQTQIFDYASFMDRLMNDQELAERILRVFEMETPAKIALMKLHLQNSDADSLQRIAHGLKGASGNISLLELYATAATLENAARSNDWDTCKQIIPKLENQFQQTIPEIHRQFPSSSDQR